MRVALVVQVILAQHLLVFVVLSRGVRVVLRVMAAQRVMVGLVALAVLVVRGAQAVITG